MSANEKLLYCNFCGKNQNEVTVLIAGPSVFICNECVKLCVEIAENYRDPLHQLSDVGCLPA